LAAFIALVLLVGLSLSYSNHSTVSGKNATEVILIESVGCTKCAAAERVLEDVNRYAPLNITGYYYYSDEGRSIVKEHMVKDVPSIIIGSRVIGYRNYDGDNAKLEQLIREALADQSQNEKPTIALLSNKSTNQSTIGDGPDARSAEDLPLHRIRSPGSGIGAGFNPCS